MTAPTQTMTEQPDTTPDEGDEFWAWVQIGRDRGWVSEPVCDTHDGPPLTTEEANEFEEGYDPCVHVLRLWPDGEPSTTA